MAIKTLRVFAEYTSTGFVPMPTAGNIDYGYTLASTFPLTSPSTFQTDDPDIDVTVTAMTDFYVWIRINGTAWNPSYTRNVRVYPDSPDINSVVMNMIIATGPAGVSSYTQIVQTANRLYFNGATTDSVYNSKFAGKTYINELNFGTAPGLSTVATTGAYADLSGKPALATVATSGSFADLSSKPSGTAPISYNSGTNSFQITQANTTTNGFLTSTDWNTFNNKYALPTGGNTTQYIAGDGTLITFPVAGEAGSIVRQVRNTTGATITKGTVVYINGASGNKPTIAKAIATGDSTSAQTFGLAQSDISNNSNGYVVCVGDITGLDTSAFTEGQQLYLSSTTAGTYTTTKQYAPAHLVYVGVITRSHPTQGEIEVKIQNGYELDEIHDVLIVSKANNEGIFYESSTGLWKNKSIPTVLGYTPYNASNPSNYIALTALSASAPLSYNNTTGVFTISQASGTTNGFLSSTDWTTFNSKQSALTLGNVTEVASNVLLFPDGGTGKTIGNLSIQVVQASASTNGFLSSTDWTTFNNKQNALTFGNLTESTSSVLTITGGTGAIIGSGASIQVKQSSSTVSGFLSSTDWTTFNSKQTALSGTGFVKISGTTISYDNSTYLTTSSATSTYLPLAGGTLTGSLNGTSATFSSTITATKATLTGGGEIVRMYGSNPYLSWWDSANTSRYGYIQASSGLINFVTDTGVALNFSVSGSDRMRITSAGNVFINRTASLNGGTYQSQKLVVTGGIGINSDSADGVSRLSLIGDSSSGDGIIDWGGNGNFNLRFTNNGTERMRITSAGNVGIGTSSPGQKLTISDTNSSKILLTGGSSQNGISFASLGSAGGNAPEFYLYNGNTNNAPGFSLYDVGNSSWRFTITNGGNMLLGTTSDNGERLYVSGSIRATGNITANSDLTLKKNLQLIDNPAEKLMSLNGYSYQWKENDEYQYGVIAQEVEKVMSYAVQTGNNGIKGVAYNQLTPLLIEGFKLHNQKIDLHASRITQLENEVQYLKAKLA